MLNRRILRIKAFKALYSNVLTQGSSKPASLSDTLSELEISCEAVRDLYVFMLGVVPSITSVAKSRIEGLSLKVHKSEEDLHPNRKFADNALSTLILEDIDFQKAWKKGKYSWDQYDIILKKIYDSARSKDYFKAYMDSPERSLAEDCKLFTKIFEEEFVDLEEIYQILEDTSIYWTDDLAYALTWCCKTLKSFAEGKSWKMPPLYQSDILRAQGKVAESDKDFVNKLLREAYEAYPEYSDMVSALVPSFDKDRLVATDMCLIVCCLAEVVNFPTIPVKVSINEYVEISKYFGTPKSSVFVNGLIDRMVTNFVNEGKVSKN